jgi:hypothetical protein
MKILIDNDRFGGAPVCNPPSRLGYPDSFVLVDRDEWRNTTIKTISELSRTCFAVKTRESLVRTLLEYLEEGIHGWNDMSDSDLYECFLTLRDQLKKDSDAEWQI